MSSAEDPKFLWLKHIRQEGLVISRAAIEDFDPILQTAEHTEEFESVKWHRKQLRKAAQQKQGTRRRRGNRRRNGKD